MKGASPAPERSGDSLKDLSFSSLLMLQNSPQTFLSHVLHSSLLFIHTGFISVWYVFILVTVLVAIDVSSHSRLQMMKHLVFVKNYSFFS